MNMGAPIEKKLVTNSWNVIAWGTFIMCAPCHGSFFHCLHQVCTVTITPWCRFEILNSVTTRQDMPVFLVLVLTCHQQSQYHRSQGLATCLIFNFSLLVTLSKFFVTNFFIFHLDIQHPVWLEKLLMSVRITYLFFPFLKKVLVYTHASVGVFTRTPFFLSCLLDATLQRMEQKWMPGRISRA
jgi:hypothetical protein